ncbi:MAG TPA: DUF2917 domain-containing protein [Burkholderiaceae bacterium]|nr:DUF2917 domain-containing protein [Burkholderiaceae bacterium]
MNIQLISSNTGGVLSLPAQAIARLHGGVRLRVLRGLLWLTVDGEPDDHMLERGADFTLPRGRKALVQALDAQASLQLFEDAPATRLGGVFALFQLARQRFAGALS